MIDPVRIPFAVLEVSALFPLLVGKESIRATMPPGRDRRVVLVGFVGVIASCALMILFMPSGLA